MPLPEVADSCGNISDTARNYWRLWGGNVYVDYRLEVRSVGRRVGQIAVWPYVWNYWGGRIRRAREGISVTVRTSDVEARKARVQGTSGWTTHARLVPLSADLPWRIHFYVARLAVVFHLVLWVRSSRWRYHRKHVAEVKITLEMCIVIRVVYSLL